MSRATRCGRVAVDEIGTGASPSFSFSSRTMRSAVFLPIPGLRRSARCLRARSPGAGPRRASRTRSRARPSGRRHHREQQLHEQVALGRVRKAIQLERVLRTCMYVCSDTSAAPSAAPPRTASPRRGSRLRRHRQRDRRVGVRDRAAAQAGDHPAILNSGGAERSQIATASASAACVGFGRSCMDRIACTIPWTCCFSARP